MLSYDPAQICELTRNAIDVEGIRRAVEDPLAGAVVLFIGTTRELTEGRRTESLDYECHEPLALAELRRLVAEGADRWPLTRCFVVHRLGRVFVKEPSVVVAVSSPHRSAAFEASEWLMDRIKESVPIWKRENWGDGTATWVHPDGSEAALQAISW